MKKIVTAAAFIAALTFAGFQIASAHGGGYFSGNNYGPAYGNNYFNGSSGSTKANRAIFDRGTKSPRSGNRFAYGHGPGMMQDYGWNSGMMQGYGGPGYGMMQGYGPGYGRMQGYGPGYGRHMMNW